MLWENEKIFGCKTKRSSDFISQCVSGNKFVFNWMKHTKPYIHTHTHKSNTKNERIKGLPNIWQIPFSANEHCWFVIQHSALICSVLFLLSLFLCRLLCCHSIYFALFNVSFIFELGVYYAECISKIEVYLIFFIKPINCRTENQIRSERTYMPVMFGEIDFSLVPKSNDYRLFRYLKQVLVGFVVLWIFSNELLNWKIPQKSSFVVSQTEIKRHFQNKELETYLFWSVLTNKYGIC